MPYEWYDRFFIHLLSADIPMDIISYLNNGISEYFNKNLSIDFYQKTGI